MIGEDDVRHVARLARLRVDDDEVGRMTGELAKILAHIDKMSELDLSDVPPTAHVLDVQNVTRADKPRAQPAARRRRCATRRPSATTASACRGCSCHDHPRHPAPHGARGQAPAGGRRDLGGRAHQGVPRPDRRASEPEVRAFILVTADNAAKYSTKVDREMQAMRGPLAGLPIAVKDNMVTESVTTTCGLAASCTTTSRSTRPRRCARSGKTTWSCWARPTWTSSPWARPPRTRRST